MFTSVWRGDRISEHGEGGSVSPRALLLPASTHLARMNVFTPKPTPNPTVLLFAMLPLQLSPYRSLTETLVGV